MNGFETPRLRLRPLVPGDAEAVFALTGDERVARFMRFSVQSAREEAVRLIQDYRTGGNAFALCGRADGGFLGVFALKPDGDGVGSISLFLRPGCWGQGLAGELLAALPVRAKRDGFRTLRAYAVGENIASRRALERAGFQVEDRRTVSGPPGGLYRYRLEL